MTFCIIWFYRTKAKVELWRWLSNFIVSFFLSVFIIKFIGRIKCKHPSRIWSTMWLNVNELIETGQLTCVKVFITLTDQITNISFVTTSWWANESIKEVFRNTNKGKWGNPLISLGRPEKFRIGLKGKKKQNKTNNIMQTKTNKETETKTKYRQQLLRGSNVMALRTFALVQTQCVNFSISCFATCVNGLRREASWFPLSGFSYL